MRKPPLIRTLFLLFLVAFVAAFADQTEVGAAAFHQAVLDVGTDMRLMCVAAHPDDEDGATLARHRMQCGCKTYAVIATRGEGGQNEIGPELNEDLAVVRTDEMAAAARITGAELHFLNLPDFGYSKSPEETFEVWGRDETVRRLVRVIREVRPDVIITHHGKAKDHGHHQAIGAALLEAFHAAADPAAFPEQREAGLEVWQTARLYIRVSEPTASSVAVNLNVLDPFHGLTYAEIAANALAEHKSQGMDYFIDWLRKSRPTVHYEPALEAPQDPRQLTGVPARGPLFEGLCDRVPASDRALSDSLAEKPPTDRTALESLRQAGLELFLTEPDASPLKKRRLARINQAAAIAAGLRLRAFFEDEVLVPGQETRLTVSLQDFGPRDAASFTFSVEPASWFQTESHPQGSLSLREDQFASATEVLRVSEVQRTTLPHAEHVFEESFLQPALRVKAAADLDGVSVPLEMPVYVDVAPRIDIQLLQAPYLVRRGAGQSLRLDVLATNYAPGPAEGALILSISPGFQLESQRIPLSFQRENEARLLSVQATMRETAEARDYFLTAMVAGTSRVRHARIRVLDIALPEAVRVGVVQSYDDTLVRTLGRLGVAFEPLQLEDFAPERLDEFSTIIVDIRAYQLRPEVAAQNQALLDYAARGGALVVLYQKTQEWKPAYAPYPIRVSRNRVTHEDAPVTVLVPDHPLFQSPNRIEPQDWAGWRQERGLYFADEWDDRYTALIACADPGEETPPGSCLIAPYGDGVYLYTALAWYRQWRDLHPGSLRLLANILALGSQ